MKSTFLKSALIFVTLFISAGIYSQVSLPAMFSDNMVLQQKADAPIWGKANPNSVVKITTSWDKKTYTANADGDGRWKTAVTTPTAGGPYEITVSEKNTIRLKNVLIGEVWLCSGQSNMEMPLAGWGKITNYEQEIADANYPNIRLLQAKKATSAHPLDDVALDSDGWQPCSPETIENFSSTAYFFGRDLHQSLNVPIGLIHTSWGGTLAEAWTSAESLSLMPDFEKSVEQLQKMPVDKTERDAFIAEQLNEWEKQVNSNDFGYENNVPVVSHLDYPDNDWQTVTLPGVWENNGFPNFDGFVWYRKVIDIPPGWSGKELVVSLGTIDDQDVTFFNGVKIGNTNIHNIARNYTVPANIVKGGKSVISVRVMDTGGNGGFYGDGERMFIAPKNKESDKIKLSGDWKQKMSVSLDEVPPMPRLNPDNQHTATVLYNAMIAPFVSYAIKGAIWYQGESNAGRAYQYGTLFPLMINDWRTKWGYDFPFYFVQLANFMKTNDEPSESTWAELREAQSMALRLNNTGMAVIIDIGDADDIHPKNKQDVGKRLALQAREKTYDQNIVGSSPIYESYKIENGKIRIHFQPNASKLVSKNGTLKGFSIAGPDRKFVWADAQIDGNEVIVSSPDVKFPVAVRYAWADNPVCNLYNEAGLPASPLRTDDWAGITINGK